MIKQNDFDHAIYMANTALTTAELDHQYFCDDLNNAVDHRPARPRT